MSSSAILREAYSLDDDILMSLERSPKRWTGQMEVYRLSRQEEAREPFVPEKNDIVRSRDVYFNEKINANDPEIVEIEPRKESTLPHVQETEEEVQNNSSLESHRTQFRVTRSGRQVLTPEYLSEFV